MQVPVVLFCVGFALATLAGTSVDAKKILFQGQTYSAVINIPAIPNSTVTTVIRIPLKTGDGEKIIKSFDIKDTQHGTKHTLKSMEGGVGYNFVNATVQSEVGKGLNLQYTVSY